MYVQEPNLITSTCDCGDVKANVDQELAIKLHMWKAILANQEFQICQKAINVNKPHRVGALHVRMSNNYGQFMVC